MDPRATTLRGMQPLTPTFIRRAELAATRVLEGLSGLPPEPEVLDATRQLRGALQVLMAQPEALTWSQRGLLETAVERCEELQGLLAPPSALQA
ncbi:hypothetical protein GCM10010844_34700 [Deinococcus radiotolerans]|uniref:Uncharacterized protein n=2 Tax=Deinococcus radiotolerans TaxID=1309407 RepID=A0ABQ2FP44_9DEIO|nr:hypothetical protein GCM10010844_34700 [Deinococcus radiotolerans]